jgi:CheY-like chemotaxis protein
VFTVEVELPTLPVPDAQRLPEPPPPGRVWLVYQRPPGGSWISALLRRLGWHAEVIYGLPLALERARLAATEVPNAVVIAEQALLPDSDLAALRASLPDACLHLLIRPDWHAPALAEAARVARFSTLVAPLTPAQLRRLGVAPTLGDGASNRHASSRAEVLLVEDNPVNQLLGKEFLHALGMGVRLATDGHEAVRACLERAPALVLMDVQMPRMDGLQATRELRALQAAGKWPGCPIVALTAHTSEEERRACHAAGMDAMLSKPLTLDTLRAHLAQWLRVSAMSS